jgi:hypothetical protein
MYEMVYRILSGGMVNKTEHKPSVYSLLSELDRAEDAGQFSERIFFSPEDEISMSLECYNPSSRLVMVYVLVRIDYLHLHKSLENLSFGSIWSKAKIW